MNESELYQRAKSHLNHWTWDRIESIVNSGQPDTTVCHGFTKRRIELKVLRSGKMWFEPSQISWATRMKRNNVWGDYVLTMDRSAPVLIPYWYIPEFALSDRKKGKYSVILKHITNVYTGWGYIDRILRESINE